MINANFRRTAGQLAMACLWCLPGIASQAQQPLRQFERQQLTGTYYSEGIAVGDLNGDGVLDVVYGPYWFAGPDFTVKHEIYPAKPQPMERYADHFFAWIYDFNGDGANDVLAVGFPGTPAYVYENPGKGIGQWNKHQVFDWVSNESPQFTDLLGDGRPELVCTRDGFFGYATVDWEQPFAPWQFHPISEKIAATRFGHGLGVGDINGDGRLDIIHAAGWFEQPARGATDGRWRLHEASLSSAYGGADMFAYDVDGDGLNDVITSEAAHDFGLSWYKQTRMDGEIQFERQVIMGSAASENRYGVLFSEPHSVALADMDGDGLLDIVTGKTYYSHHQQSPMWDAGAVVYWFKLVRTEDGVDWLPYLIDGTTGIGRQLVVADVDQDGLPDVATGGMLGAHVLLQRIKSVSDQEYQAAQPKLYTAPAASEQSPQTLRLRGGRNPVADDGKVSGAIEAEHLSAHTTRGTAKPQHMQAFKADRWSGQSQLWWTGARPGETLTLELDALAEIETLQMALTCAPDYAIVQVRLNGQPLSPPIDLYEPHVMTTGLLEFPTGRLPAGKHQLTFEIVGANAKAARKYMLGLDWLRFVQTGQSPQDATTGIRPLADDGRVLNLDFETGTLQDWTAEGQAFEGQPIQGDTVARRRDDSSSLHEGHFWIGGYEKLGDAPQGTLTSVPFRVTAPYASFLVGGGPPEKARVELYVVGETKPFFVAGGKQVENLAAVVVDLQAVQGKQIYIRLVDASSAGWGHINFDHFRFHQQTPAEPAVSVVPLVEDDYPYALVPADKAAQVMVVPEGFQVTVGAAEPDVRQPIAMALDDRGRTWIAEAYEYPIRAVGDRGRDRILIFEDTTGDGKLDSRKVFYEGLNLVSGLEVGFGGVWVGAAPYLMFIPDVDGDDVPDSQPQILLDGWGYQDTHETLNTFCWGPDGWLYGCHGVFTHSRVGKPGTPDDQREPINAGVWRYHPTRHEFEVFAHGTSNPWGLDFNDVGEAFCTACVIPHLFHVIPQARYQRQAGRHFNRHTYGNIVTIADHLHYLGTTPHGGNNKSDAAGGGHAHAGAMIYLGGAWPPEYHGGLLMNNIHGQRLNMDLLEPRGSGYVGKHGPDFLLSRDQASQILNMRYGPDGQVVFIDWYDMQACHRLEVEVHDRSNGRIFKVHHGPLHPVHVDLARLSDLELAEQTLNANDWFVRHARRLLQERAASGTVASEAIARLRQIATTHAEATRRLRAIWALHGLGAIDEATHNQLQTDASEHVRGWSVRLLLERQQDQLTAAQLTQWVKMAGEDDSPVVRLALASAANRLPPESRWELVAQLAAHADDRHDHNLPLLYWYAMEPLAEVDPDRALALGLTTGNAIPLLREYMLRRLAESGDEASIERLVAGLGKVQASDLQQTFLEAIKSALAGQRRAARPRGWAAVYRQLQNSPSPDVQRQAMALGVAFGDGVAMQAMREQLIDPSAAIEDRLSAIEALLAAGDEALVGTLLTIIEQPSGSDELVQRAIQGLAQYDQPAIAKTLLAHYPKLTAAGRRLAIATLSSRKSGARALLDAIAAGQIEAADLTADLARQIDYLEDPQLSEQLGQVWGQVRKTSEQKLEQIKRYQQLVERGDLPPPDLALGRMLFAKTCQRCHVLYGAGQQLGPDITGSNRANLDYLLENIIDPSAVMAKEYRQSVVLTDNGQVITGIVRSETDNALTIQTAESLVVVPRDEIESLKESDLSMMPEDQLNPFNEHEIRSLIAYLRHKSQTPLLATAENAGELFNGRDLTGWNGNLELWSVEGGELIGRTSGLKRNEFLVSDLLARDFRLSLEVKLVENKGNSGIQFRSQALDDGDVAGYQADIGAGWWGKLYEEHGRQLLWKEGAREHVRVGEWNLYEIEAVGSHIRTWLNGQPCVDLDDPEGSREGIFALQLHSGPAMEIRFRNFKLEIK